YSLIVGSVHMGHKGGVKKHPSRGGFLIFLCFKFLSMNYLISWYELQVPELRTLAIQRNRAVVEGIRKRLPPGAPAAAELLLHSVIAGATMQWAVDPDGELADHVLAQIAAILCLMFPEHDDFQLLQAHA
ncbi:hypothetical protein PJ029_24970, partial [Escherichia coli]|nr:hypothetical protein [Escherichia coli]